jgi:hypothetical protein
MGFLGQNNQTPETSINSMVRSSALNPSTYVNDSIFLAGFTPKIVNISSYIANLTEITVMGYGKKFCPTPMYNDLLGLKVDITEFVRKLQLKERFGSIN